MQPEKLNLWDRIFNRYRIEATEGEEEWVKYSKFDYSRRFPQTFVRCTVNYKKIDRLTGSVVKIWKEYLN